MTNLHPTRGCVARPRRRLALLAALLLLAAVPATARTLSWSSMKVEARLDAEGRLHVVETQAMVFDGDWNGGERGFNLRDGQRIELHRLTRIEPESGAESELVGGSLGRVDHFDWVDSSTLRWRSRRPSDPPFDHQRIVYRLDYTLSGILRDVGDDYLLDHDFAFPDRPGAIDRFELTLELDPVWRALAELPSSLQRSDLPPGQSVVVTARLAHSGPDRPADVAHSLPRWLWLAVFAVALAIMVVLFIRFVAAERRFGRFSAPRISDPIEPAWLEEHVLELLPEEVGALWDRSVGAPEVAALIARLVGEGKLSSSVREEHKWLTTRRILTLELLVDRDSLRGYEGKLIRKLFFDRRTITDTEAIREHYKGKGFSPTTTISSDLERRLRERPQALGKRPAPSWRPTATIAAAFLTLALTEGLVRGLQSGLVLLAVAGVCILPSFFGWGMAGYFSRRLSGYAVGALGFILPALFIWLLCFGTAARTDPTVWDGPSAGLAALLATALLPIGLFHSFLNWARSRESKETLHQRHRLFAAREWIIEELKRDRPRLRDEWFPYLLALGLDDEVDDWFGSFGHSATTASRTTSTSLGGGSTGGATWTGGGGAFGGAGATAAWSAAATSLAAGVASPSSSGSGGGSSGGSSGGGSGGGW